MKVGFVGSAMLLLVGLGIVSSYVGFRDRSCEEVQCSACTCGEETPKVRCPQGFPNYHEGRCWSDVLSITHASLNWGEAEAFCKAAGGRLPTISELRTLIIDSPDTETGGRCKITDDNLVATGSWSDYCRDDKLSGVEARRGILPGELPTCSIFGDSGIFWSSSAPIEEYLLTPSRFCVQFGYFTCEVYYLTESVRTGPAVRCITDL